MPSLRNSSLDDVDPHLVTLLRPDSFEAEQYRRLRQQVERLRVERGVRVIAVTSPVASDGKTITAINLAATLAESSHASVLLIDADLRRPSVAERLGDVTDSGGLVEALRSKTADLQQFIRETRLDNLSMMPSGQSPGSSYELLTSPRLTELLHEAWERYTFVIVDTPPLIPVPDAGLLGRAVDGYLVVVAAHSTPRRLLGESLNMLEPASVLGLVFNRDDEPLFGQYQRHYKQYFEAPRRSGRTAAARTAGSMQ